MPFPFFRKFLALLVIAALLSMRLSSLTEQVFVEPVEDAIFDIAFIAAEESQADGKPLKVKPKRAFDIVLTPVDELRHHNERPRPELTPVFVVLILRDLHADIFIPPETLS